MEKKDSLSPPPAWSQRILRLRLERGWSQEKLAKSVDLDVKSIRRWEKGEVTPQLYSRQKLAEVFGVTQIDLGFLQEVSQQQDQQGNLTIQAPERPEDEDQTAETDYSAMLVPHANVASMTTVTKPVISHTPDGHPRQRNMQALLQKHAWWLRPLAIVLLIVVTGICIAWLAYLLIIRPYMQDLERQQPAFHAPRSGPVQDKLDYLYTVSHDA